jgi:hypothetical protein
MILFITTAVKTSNPTGFVLFTKHYYGDEKEKEKMGDACNTHVEIRNTYSILV